MMIGNYRLELDPLSVGMEHCIILDEDGDCIAKGYGFDESMLIAFALDRLSPSDLAEFKVLYRGREVKP